MPKKAKQLWFIFGSGLLFSLALLLPTTSIFAAEEVLIDINSALVGSVGPAMYDSAWSPPQRGLVGIIAPGSSITQINARLISGNENHNETAYLCKDFDADQVCDDTPVAADSSDYVPYGNSDWSQPTWTWADYETTPGEVYMLEITTDMSYSYSVAWYADDTLLISESDEIAYFRWGYTPDKTYTPTIKIWGEASIPANRQDLTGLELFFNNPYKCPVNSTCKIRYSYNENVFTSYDQIKVYELESPIATTSTLVQTSSVIDYFYSDKQNGQSWTTLSATSTGRKYYEVKGELAAYWDASLGQNVAATSTVAYSLVVDFGDREITEILPGISTDPATTTWGGLTPHELACSSQDWTDIETEAASWYDFFSVKAMKCLTLEAFYEILFKISDVAQSAGNSMALVMSNTFPINIPVKIVQTWKQSENTTIPTGLNWLNKADENGNIYANIPAQLMGTTTPILIFGPGLYDGNTEMEEVFAGIRFLSTYVMAGLFFLGLYKVSLKIYEEMTEKEE